VQYRDDRLHPLSASLQKESQAWNICRSHRAERKRLRLCQDNEATASQRPIRLGIGIAYSGYNADQRLSQRPRSTVTPACPLLASGLELAQRPGSAERSVLSCEQEPSTVYIVHIVPRASAVALRMDECILSRGALVGIAKAECTSFLGCRTYRPNPRPQIYASR
jgi:hypothetical protein